MASYTSTAPVLTPEATQIDTHQAQVHPQLAHKPVHVQRAPFQSPLASLPGSAFAHLALDFNDAYTGDYVEEDEEDDSTGIMACWVEPEISKLDFKEDDNEEFHLRTTVVPAVERVKGYKTIKKAMRKVFRTPFRCLHRRTTPSAIHVSTGNKVREPFSPLSVNQVVGHLPTSSSTTLVETGDMLFLAASAAKLRRRAPVMKRNQSGTTVASDSTRPSFVRTDSDNTLFSSDSTTPCSFSTFSLADSTKATTPRLALGEGEKAWW
ncbi:hypothetical protein JCM11641_004235 [Rhodosporidiobolus odoratus]